MDFVQSFKVHKLLPIGHLIKYEKTLFWLISVQGTEESQVEVESSALLRLERTLQKSLVYIFNSLEEAFQVDTYPSPSQIQSAQQCLTRFLAEIYLREDIMTLSCTKQLFGINDPENELLNRRRQVPALLVNRLQASEQLSVQNMVYDIEQGTLGVITQNRSELSKIGRVWSIIEPEILGEFKMFTRQKDHQDRVVYQQTLLKQYEQKVLSLCYQPLFSRFVFGFHSGKVAVHNFCRNGQGSVKDIEVFASNEPVLFLVDLGEGVVLMSTSGSLKGVQVTSSGMDILWGGSLKQRLQGGTVITQHTHPSTQALMLFLGSDNGMVLLYLVDKGLKSGGTLQVRPGRVNALSFKKGNLFVAQEQQVYIYAYSAGQKTVFRHTASFQLGVGLPLPSECFVSCVAYYDSQKVFLTGLSNGLLLCWNAQTGEVQGAQKVSQARLNTIHLYQDYEVAMLCTDAGEILTLKFGDIPQ